MGNWAWGIGHGAWGMGHCSIINSSSSPSPSSPSSPPLPHSPTPPLPHSPTPPLPTPHSHSPLPTYQNSCKVK
ncbi:MAG: hypothetical protein V7K27_33215 [Nostoc sp.]|uniref:hypothetical protein n=1 Tax=Nostoc sp. TaxID=1180 RepID=UPI002FF72446